MPEPETPPAGMLETMQNAIIGELEDINGVKTVDTWQGTVDELLKTPLKMPSLHVVYQGGVFQPFEQVGQWTTCAMDFLIILIAQNQKSRQAGSVAANLIIESVRDKLIGFQIADYDFLRPIREDLLMAQGGILAYGLIYGLKNVLIATE
jgi:phage gp37-like protein